MKKISLLLLSLILSGCFHTQSTKETITFQQAMKDIVKGLNEFRGNPNDKQIFGLVPSEIEATFNISVNKSKTNETNLTIDPTNVVKEITGLSSKWSSEVKSQRENQITIKFRNILFAKEKEAVYEKDNIVDIIKKLKDSGLIIHNT